MSHPIDVEAHLGLGKCQWGIDRLETHNTWANSALAIARGLGAGSLASTKASSVSPLPYKATQGADERNLWQVSVEQEMSSLLQMDLGPGSPIRMELKNFCPLKYIKGQAQPDAQVNRAGYNLWKIWMMALAMPGGQTWLMRVSSTANSLKSGQYIDLQSLAKQCLETFKEKGTIPDIGWSTEVSFEGQTPTWMAAHDVLSTLTASNRAQVRAPWAAAASKNQLNFENDLNKIARIEERLFKFGVWLERAGKKRTIFQIVTGRSKTPFKSLRQGFLNANSRGSDQIAALGKRGKGKLAKKSWVNNLCDLVDNMQGASRFKLRHGSRWGLSIKGASLTLSQIMTAGILRLKLGLSVHYQRLCGFELAMPPYNMELLLYSGRSLEVTGGLGLGTGVEAGVTRGVVGVDLQAIELENAPFRGISLRLPRIRGQEAQLRVQFKKLLHELSQAKRSANQQTGVLLKRLLTQFPDLSVSELGDYTETKRKHGLSAEVGLRVGLPHLEVGLNGSAGLKLQSQGKRQIVDTDGAISVIKSLNDRNLRGTLGVGVDLRSPIHCSNNTANAGKLELLGGNASVFRAGRLVRQDLVIQNNAVHPMSFIEVEYRSLADFQTQVGLYLNHWIEERAQAKKINRTQAEAEVQSFLNALSKNCKPGHSFAMRGELRSEVVDQLNQLNWLIHATQLSDSAEAKKKAQVWQTHFDNLVKSNSSYFPCSFRVYERLEENNNSGLRAGLQIENVKFAEGTHAFERLM